MVIMEEQRQTERLVERAKAGDRAAFETIVARFHDRLQTAVRHHLGARRDAAVEVDDVVQETFARAFGAVDRFTWRGEDSLYPWLYGIAKNVALRFAEKSNKLHSLEIPERLAADDIAPSKAARRDERFDRLERCLEKLKPEYREVLRLARLEGLTVHEIAERMNRTEYSVKHLIARAIRQLRESFGDTESLTLPPRSLGQKKGRHGNG